jgi:hypothetical protein
MMVPLGEKLERSENRLTPPFELIPRIADESQRGTTTSRLVAVRRSCPSTLAGRHVALADLDPSLKIEE